MPSLLASRQSRVTTEHVGGAGVAAMPGLGKLVSKDSEALGDGGATVLKKQVPKFPRGMLPASHPC